MRVRSRLWRSEADPFPQHSATTFPRVLTNTEDFRDSFATVSAALIDVVDFDVTITFNSPPFAV